jgi:hypothetical protein
MKHKVFIMSYKLNVYLSFIYVKVVGVFCCRNFPPLLHIYIDINTNVIGRTWGRSLEGVKRIFFFIWCARFDIRKQKKKKTKEINWLIGKQIPSIYRKQITHLHKGNQTTMELRNRTVKLRQQVQHSRHAEISIQNSQCHSKRTLVCNKSYCTYRLQHFLRKWHHPLKEPINFTTTWKPIPVHY